MQTAAFAMALAQTQEYELQHSTAEYFYSVSMFMEDLTRNKKTIPLMVMVYTLQFDPSSVRVVK